jgi:hypothetical protein
MYDPNLPQAGTEIDAVQMRGQFNGLKDLIDALQTITGAVVDGVNTLPAGDPAAVDLSVNAGVLHFSIDLPQGADGPPFATVVVDAVNTLDHEEPATVDASFDGSQVHLTFGLPRGHTGVHGNDGIDGAPGEVSLQQLEDAIATTSANSNTVALLGLAVSDPPTQVEMQQIADKLDELIMALRR